MGGRTRRHRGLVERSERHLHRLRRGRRVQVGRQRRQLPAGLPDVRHARRSATSRFIRRIRTSSTSARANRTIARRRRSATASTRSTDGGKTFTNIGLKETQTIARIVIDPEESGSRLRRVARSPLRSERRARRLQDDRRRQDVEQDQVHRREHRLHGHRHRSIKHATCSTRRAISVAAPAAASTAAARAARSGRPKTPARRGRS